MELDSEQSVNKKWKNVLERMSLSNIMVGSDQSKGKEQLSNSKNSDSNLCTTVLRRN